MSLNASKLHNFTVHVASLTSHILAQLAGNLSVLLSAQDLFLALHVGGHCSLEGRQLWQCTSRSYCVMQDPQEETKKTAGGTRGAILKLQARC